MKKAIITMSHLVEDLLMMSIRIDLVRLVDTEIDIEEQLKIALFNQLN